MVIIQNEEFKKENSESNPYGMLRVSSSRRAANELTGTAYKVFVELALNKSSYALALSPEAFEKAIGISKSAYKGAISELIDLGYLSPEPSGNHKNTYIFTPNPPRVDIHPRKDRKSKGSKVTLKSTKNVPTEKEGNSMVQKSSSESPKSNLLKVQKEAFESTKNTRETIQDSIYNTDSTNVSGVKNGLSENDVVFSLDEDIFYDEYEENEDDEIDITLEPTATVEEKKSNGVPYLDKDISNENNDVESVSLRLAFDDAARHWGVRNRFKTIYRKKVERANESPVIRAILDTYLSTHSESFVQSLRRLKYGVWIKGWNTKKREPIIYYPYVFLFDHEMQHINVGDIPEDYYIETLHFPPTQKIWSVQHNRYKPKESAKQVEESIFVLAENTSNETTAEFDDLDDLNDLDFSAELAELAEAEGWEKSKDDELPF